MSFFFSTKRAIDPLQELGKRRCCPSFGHPEIHVTTAWSGRAPPGFPGVALSFFGFCAATEILHAMQALPGDYAFFARKSIIARAHSSG